jgi:uncharacterized protein YecT (DUF1311 family)
MNRYFVFAATLALLAGCSPSSDANQQQPEAGPNTLVLLATGSAKACAASDVQDTLVKLFVPDTAAAKEAANADTYRVHAADIDGLLSAVKFKVDMITLSAVDKSIRSVTCDAAVTITAPGYGYQTPRPINIQYEIRPSAQSADSFVISSDTAIVKAAAQNMFDQVVSDASARLPEPVPTPAPSPATTFGDMPAAPAELSKDITSQPSFDCRRVTSYVLTQICSDPALTDLDNRLDLAYRRKLDAVGTADRENVIAGERRWIAIRQACEDRPCIAEAYRSRLSELDE